MIASDVCTKTYDKLPRRYVHRIPFATKTVTSAGIIAYAMDTKKVLLVRRKYSACFYIILSGAYRDDHLPFLVPGLTDYEISVIKRMMASPKIIPSVYKEILGESSGSYNSWRYLCDRYSSVNLSVALNSVVGKKEPEWLFPKGRPLARENGLACALREFKEETGLDISDNSTTLIMPSPLTEINHVVAGKVLESKLYIALYRSQPEDIEIEPTHDEIGAARWVSEEEALVLLDEQKHALLVQALRTISPWVDVLL